MAFREFWLAKDTMWQAVVMIPKGIWYYRVIGLVGVMWKVMTVVINCHLTISISFCDVLHVLRLGCGMGTASLETKLIHQLISMK